MSTTFVDPKLAARLGWDVRKGTVQMWVQLVGGMAGPLVTDTVIRSCLQVEFHNVFCDDLGDI